MEVATFGAGCFWGVEARFRRVEGVVTTEVGYSGGEYPRPSYEDVCTGRTGHAEVVRVEFDPEKVPYEELLRVFFEVHDPTQLDRQGPDVGTQYRSVIFFHDEEQERKARALADEVAGRFPEPVVTRIEPAREFWRAEEYHQQYLAKRGRTACASTIRDREGT